jgi:hypothetical protein
MSIRVLKQHKKGEVWTWQEDIVYTILLVFSLGFAFEEYRREIATEFAWGFWSGFWILILVTLLFFAPMLIFFPITIPTYILYLHWRQTTDAKNLIIKTLREK